MIKYQIFLHIAESGNFTKTAEAFGYTQSAVSQMVRSLEKEFNVRLFTRTKSGVVLTADGKGLVPYARKIYDDYLQLLEHTSSIKHLDGSVVRVGVFASISANFLPPVIKKFKETYPNVQFKLLQADYETIKQWIKDGTVDFGFLTKDVADNLKSIHLIRDEMVMILPKTHPAGKKETLTMSDFSEDPFIFLDQGKKSEPLEYFIRAGIEPNQQYHVYDDYTIINMVEQGLGVSILPKLVLYKHHQDIIVRSLTPPIFREVCVAYKSDDSISVAGKTFMECVLLSAASNKFYPMINQNV